MRNLCHLQRIRVLLVREGSKKRLKIRKMTKSIKLNFKLSWMRKRLKKPRKDWNNLEIKGKKNRRKNMKSLILSSCNRLSYKISKFNKKVKMWVIKFAKVAKQSTLAIQKVEAMSQPLHLVLKLLATCPSVVILIKSTTWMRNFFWLIWNFLRKILKNKLS